MRFIVTPTTAWPVGSARVVRFLTTGDVQLATFVIGYDGNMGVDVGGGSLRYTSSPYTLGVPIYVWVHYIEGTGSGDATVEGFFSLDGIKPDDPTVSEDASNLTGAAAKIDIREHQGAAATYDDLIVSATVLGDF